MVARGKRLCAQPLDQPTHTLRPFKGRRKQHQTWRSSYSKCATASTSPEIKVWEVLYALFRAGRVIDSNPGGDAPSACPWLPSAAPPALVESLLTRLCPVVTEILLRLSFKQSLAFLGIELVSANLSSYRASEGGLHILAS